MKTLQEFIIEQLNEAVEPETTFEIRNGKNIYSGNAKKIIVTGQADYAEVYINKDAKVEVVDFTGCQCKTIRIDVIQCNKLKEIIGGSGDNLFCSIRKNANLEKLEFGSYQMFSDGKGGQMSYIDKNKKLTLTYDNLPKMVDAQHGLDIENVSGKHIMRSNGMTSKEPVKDIK